MNVELTPNEVVVLKYLLEREVTGEGDLPDTAEFENAKIELWNLFSALAEEEA